MENKLKHNYKNMDIWKDAVNIAETVYKLVANYPKNEQFGLISQMSRSSVSIASNIAEGSSRTNRAFVNYLSISLGSSFELETQLIISKRRGYVGSEDYEDLMSRLDVFQKMTTGFQNSLSKSI